MIKKQVTDPVFPQCPIRNVLARIGDRWSLLILLALQDSHRQMRFKDLCQAIPDVSQKMLASTLKELEADRLIVRKEYPQMQQPLTMVLLKEKHRCTKWLSTTLDMIISERRVDIFTLGSLRSRRATP